MEEFKIPNEPLKGSQQKIKLSDQVLRQNSPPSLNIDPAAPIKATNPQLVIQTFGIQFAQTEIYKGRIPISTPDQSTIARKSKLGTSIFSDLQFITADGLDNHIPVDTALFDVHQAKLITRTAVQGRKRGRIKENNGEDDYEITIRGVICGDNGVYPFDHVKNLLDYCRYDQSLGIISRYLNELYDVNEIVIYDYSFEQPEGSQSYQKFELKCWSDEPVEILIQEAKNV